MRKFKKNERKNLEKIYDLMCALHVFKLPFLLRMEVLGKEVIEIIREHFCKVII